MDNVKTSHVESTVINEILRRLKEQYGKVSPLTTTLGRINDYPGMVLHLIMEGKVIVMTTKHIQRILETIHTDMDGLIENPYDNHLFQV